MFACKKYTKTAQLRAPQIVSPSFVGWSPFLTEIDGMLPQIHVYIHSVCALRIPPRTPEAQRSGLWGFLEGPWVSMSVVFSMSSPQLKIMEGLASLDESSLRLLRALRTRRTPRLKNLPPPRLSSYPDCNRPLGQWSGATPPPAVCWAERRCDRQIGATKQIV